VRFGGAATAALLLLSGCTGGDEPDRAVLVDEALADETVPRAWASAPSDGDTSSVDPMPIGTGWGPSTTEIERARELVAELSLRERAGQVVVARYAGTTPPSDLVNRLHLGGVVMFSDNVRSTRQVASGNRALQRAARSSRSRWPSTRRADWSSGSPAAPGSPRS
jgi:beta-N-acetylhexosaminidase